MQETKIETAMAHKPGGAGLMRVREVGLARDLKVSQQGGGEK